ncbi:DUF6531 domain-containing protein, partial [Methyloversatilis discipulorum]|uniref:DUF6531 domain-containing protein n=1 Tax=Methyloversatilis discipulorum TaxID=1119528 RepID=UPI0026F10620
MQSTFFPVLKLIVCHIGVSGLLLSTAVCYAAYPARHMWMFDGSGYALGQGTFDGSTYYSQSGVALALFEHAGPACAAASAYNNQPYGGVYEIIGAGGVALCFRPDGQQRVSISRLAICHEGPNSSGGTNVYYGYEPCTGTPVCPVGQFFNFSKGLCEPESRIAVGKSRSAGNQCPSTSHPIGLGSGNKYLSESDVSSGSLGFVRSYNSLSIQAGYSELVTGSSTGVMPLGVGWSVGYQQQIRVSPSSGSTAWAIRPSGRVFTFGFGGTAWVA